MEFPPLGGRTRLGRAAWIHGHRTEAWRRPLIATTGIAWSRGREGEPHGIGGGAASTRNTGPFENGRRKHVRSDWAPAAPPSVGASNYSRGTSGRTDRTMKTAEDKLRRATPWPTTPLARFPSARSTRANYADLVCFRSDTDFHAALCGPRVNSFGATHEQASE